MDDVLDNLAEPALLLILDGVTDPHNLGACLRVADGAGAHAVIAPKDRSCGLTAAAAKVASGAAETVPFIVVTNLGRTMRDLKDRGVWLVGAADEAPQSLWQARLDGALGMVLGALVFAGFRPLLMDRAEPPDAAALRAVRIGVAHLVLRHLGWVYLREHPISHYIQPP